MPIVLVLVTDLSAQYAVYAVPLAILARVLEGVFDGLRAKAGDVRPADVGAFAQPLAR